MTSATRSSQLVGPSGLGEAGPSYVVVELELGVVDPHRVVEAEGHPERPLAQPGHQMDPLLDHPADLGVTGGRREERPSALGRVEHQHGRHMQVGVGRLERQEGAVEAGERFHRQRPLCPKPPVPRWAGGRSASATASNSAVATSWITSWAIRSPRRTS